jgi:hypothetical protein
MSAAKKADNFMFSNSDKRRGCKDILVVEGPLVTVCMTVETMTNAVFKERGLFISSQGTFVCSVLYNEQLFLTFSPLIKY